MLTIRIFIIFIFLSTASFGQDLISVVAETNQGTIFLNSNYMKTDRLGVQKIVMIPIKTSFCDMFAWKWVKRNIEYKFDLWNGEIYFVRTSHGKNQRFRVFSVDLTFTEYNYNDEIKEF